MSLDTPRPFILSILLGVFLVTLQLPVSTDAEYKRYVFWTDEGTGKIERVELDGSNREEIIGGLTGVRGFDVDGGRERLYFTIGPAPGKVQAVNFDGKGFVSLVTAGPDGVTPLGELNGLALDQWNYKMYWAEVDALGVGKILRANFVEGDRNVELVLTGLNTPQEILYDNTDGTIWWTDSGAGQLGNAERNGTVLSVDNLPGIWGFRGDRINHVLYWTDTTRGSIFEDDDRGGLGPREIVKGLNKPTGIDLDMVNEKIYWVDETAKKIMRANFDGSGSEDVLTGLVLPRYVRIADAPLPGARPVRVVPFSNKYVLMALLALLGGWLVFRKR